MLAIAQKNYKNILFVIVSSQILYLGLHLQFVFGMPQAGLTIRDSLYFLFIGVGLFLLSQGDKLLYFTGYLVILWPTVILQYFYIKIFNKPFLISELLHFLTLLQISPIYLKISYTILFILWIGAIGYLGYRLIKIWYTLRIYSKIVPLIIIGYYSYFFLTPITAASWREDPTANFFFRGILETITTKTIESNIILSPDTVTESVNYLKNKEQRRQMYPISQSPQELPLQKRPIIILTFESFYDYKHFLPLFEKDPFPQEYRQLMNQNTYTGPNQSFGSFDARFVSLTGSLPFESLSRNKDIPYQTLGNILSNYGYRVYALESVNPTYSLPTYYKLWGFQIAKFELFGNDWGGKRINPDTYEKNITKIIQETPDEITPFYFGFTFLGHGNSCQFTEKLADPNVNLTPYLSLFKDQKRAKQLLKANIFNAQRLLSIKKMILKKYPDALIVFKADHYSTELYQSMNSPNNQIPNIYIEAFKNDPAPLPFLVIDGTNGILPIAKGFSPANIPLMVLAESQLPYKDTTLSLFYRDIPKNMLMIYHNWYSNEQLFPISLETNKEYFDYYQAIRTVSQDLYKNQSNSLTLKLITNHDEK
ncbi:MAG: hypothetical protein ACRCWI_03235 [Brevinema sp.]